MFRLAQPSNQISLYTNIRHAIWFADITYVKTHQGWLYLAAVMDIWSRKDRRPVDGFLHDGKACG